MRGTVIRTFWEMHKGRSLDYWLGKMKGANGKPERWMSLMVLLGPNNKEARLEKKDKVLKDVKKIRNEKQAKEFTILTPYEAEVIEKREELREELRENLKIFKENWNKSEYLIA
jgi:hypothetical protein